MIFLFLAEKIDVKEVRLPVDLATHCKTIRLNYLKRCTGASVLQANMGKVSYLVQEGFSLLWLDMRYCQNIR